MNHRPAGRLVRPTRLTKLALAASATIIVWSGVLLLARYPALPWLLPVHFKSNGDPNGWQYKTYWRVLMPIFVQISLVVVLGAVAFLLLSRRHGEHDERQPDVKAASVAAEAVVLLGTIWIAFQGYAAVALTAMWQREQAGLG